MPSILRRCSFPASVLAFALFGTNLYAQQKADCAKFASLGCQSFNELIEAKDSDILAQIKSPSTAARVCFVEGEDDFSILSYLVPSEASWHKSKDGFTYTTRPMFSSFIHYQDGVAGNSFVFRVTWETAGEDGDWTAVGKEIGTGKASLTIYPDEINIKATYLNKSKTFTSLTFTIRVATGRFKETYTYPDDKGKTTGNGAAGHCVRYENGIAESPHPQ